jgi:hypothetical protein
MTAPVTEEVFSMPLLERAAIERLRLKRQLTEGLIQVGLLAVLSAAGCIAFIRWNWAQGVYALIVAMLVAVVIGYVTWGLAGEALLEWVGMDPVQYEWLPPTEVRELAAMCDDASGVRPFLEQVRVKARPVSCGEACAIYDWLEVHAGLGGLTEGLERNKTEK